jgi:uncharacterized membrane protein
MSTKKLYLVIQQGGSSREMYVHAHGTLTEARKDRKSCEKASYQTTEPILVPAALATVLLSNMDACGDFYNVMESTLRLAAELI